MQLVPDEQVLSFEDQIRAVPTVVIDEAAVRQMSTGQVAKLEGELRRYRETLQANPLLGYVPAGEKHWRFHHAIRTNTKHRWIFGGNRAGKTTTAIVDDLIQICPQALVPAHLRQWKKYECPCYIRVVAPDMERTTKPVLHQKIKEWCPPSLFVGGDFDKSWHDKSATLRFTCGCRMDFLSYEMGLNKFGGAALHRIHWDESPPEDLRAESLMRLIDFDGDEIGSMTPLMGLDHIYRQVYKRRGEDFDSGRPKIRAWTIGIRDNRRLSEDAIEAALGEIASDEDRARREHGLFTELGGQVYKRFYKAKKARTLTDAQLIELLRTRMNVVCAIDPGARWAGVVWIAFDSANHALVFDAVRLESTHAGDIAAKLHARAARWGIRPQYVIDPAAKQRSQVNGQTVLSELARHGIHATPGVNDVQTGVWNVRWRLDAGSLSIYEDLEIVFDEATEYSLVERDDGVFEIKKGNDHVLDALRYGVMQRPWIPPQTQIWTPGGEHVVRPPMRQAKTGPPEGALV